MLNIENPPLVVLLELAKIKDERVRNKAITGWYDFYIKELTWFFESSTDAAINPLSFADRSYTALKTELSNKLCTHPNVVITTKFIPELGRVRITAAVGLLRLNKPRIDENNRNEIEGLRLPRNLLE